MTDEAFLKALQECTLPASEFGHRGHLRLAFLVLKQSDLEVAIEDVCRLIQRYAEHLGAHDKFHYTLTYIWVRLVWGRMQHAKYSRGFDSFLNENKDLLDSGEELISRHYSSDRIKSDVARYGFVSPDREPFYV